MIAKASASDDGILENEQEALLLGQIFYQSLDSFFCLPCRDSPSSGLGIMNRTSWFAWHLY